MFLKFKIVMVEFSDPGIILMPKTHAGNVCKASKIVEDFVLNSRVCVSPMTDSTAWRVAARRAGSARQRQNQRELSTTTTQKDVLGPNKPLALHELIVRIDHF